MESCTDDQDGDEVPDCVDGCLEGILDKTEPGLCGCGVPDVDSDGDGAFDCEDPCPAWPGSAAMKARRFWCS